MKGRKPTPTPLRVIRGNPSKRALPAHEAKAEAKLPPAPEHLSDEAQAEWERLGRELERLGLVSEIDKAMLAAYCSAWGRLVDGEQKLREFGSIMKSPNGMLVQSPYLQIVNKAIEQLSKIAPEFGMTPSSRSRVTAAATKGEGAAEDKWAGLLS